jgi:acyl-coenzyme A thioesterase PaaI-like protein
LASPTNDAKLIADTLRDLIAAFTLMPPGSGILTVEFKTNLLAPARGERFAFDASRCPLRSKAR